MAKGRNAPDSSTKRSAGGTPVAGLTSGTTYFVITDGTSKVKLAATRDQALKGDALALTVIGDEGGRTGLGRRTTGLIALEHTVDESASGLLTGKAPRGAVLRLRKSFATPTWEGSFADGVHDLVLAPDVVLAVIPDHRPDSSPSDRDA